MLSWPYCGSDGGGGAGAAELRPPATAFGEWNCFLFFVYPGLTFLRQARGYYLPPLRSSGLQQATFRRCARLCHSDRREESAVCRQHCRRTGQQIPHRLKPVRNDNHRERRCRWRRGCGGVHGGGWRRSARGTGRDAGRRRCKDGSIVYRELTSLRQARGLSAAPPGI
jgi:hypothetical protein